jgi:hypothetical protein
VASKSLVLYCRPPLQPRILLQSKKGVPAYWSASFGNLCTSCSNRCTFHRMWPPGVIQSGLHDEPRLRPLIFFPAVQRHSAVDVEEVHGQHGRGLRAQEPSA